MFNLVQIFSFFWLLSTARSVLFWIYLWQLKEYHVGRFADHFRTEKGKRIFVNFLFIVKVILFLFFFIDSAVAITLFLILYIAETLLLVFRRSKLPVWTIKTVLLISVSLIATGLFLAKALSLGINSFALWLLIFNILVPVIASAIVLLCQPLFVLKRNQILEEAKNKISAINKKGRLTVVGVTGSYGKTSTKEFLTTILSSKFRVLTTPDHKNSEMGISETILKDLKEDHEIFVVEMGAYSVGGIDLLCDIAKPRIGIVTGVNEQHLATFGSMENLLSAEGGQELVKKLPEDGILIVNGDNKYCLDLYRKAKISKMVYSLNNNKVESDIWAEEITVREHTLDFLVVTKEKETAHIQINALGRHNIQNVLGAMLVARELGMSLAEIVKSVKNIRQEQTSMKSKKGIHGINIIDSSYSSNPDGVIADLDYLDVFLGKKVIVMPCLIELGEKSKEIHERIGRKVAEVCDMAIITTKERFQDIKRGAMREGMKEGSIIFEEKPKEILNLVTTFCKQGDAVLVEGGRQKELVRILDQ